MSGIMRVRVMHIHIDFKVILTVLGFVSASFAKILVDFNTAILIFIRECMGKGEVTMPLLVAIYGIKFCYRSIATTSFFLHEAIYCLV